MYSRNPQIFWTSALLLVGMLAWVGYSFSRGDGLGEMVENITFGGLNTETVAPLGEGQSVEKVSGNENLFKHAMLGFYFQYPRDFSISSFGNFYDSVGETILMQKSGSVEGLQIHITPFDEDILLSVSRIKKDLPSLNITNAKEQSLGAGENKTQAVIFSSTNNLSTGNSLEAWFVYRKQLYQISTSATSGDLFDKIINTWVFE